MLPTLSLTRSCQSTQRLLHQAALHAELSGDRRHLPGVVGLKPPIETSGPSQF